MENEHLSYASTKELKEDWFTVSDLLNILKENGFRSTLHSLKRWERSGIIPEPRRIICKNLSWRVYSKDGSDFKEIIDSLSKKSVRTIKMS